MSSPPPGPVTQFLERMGVSLQEEGWPPIAGRMLALFVYAGGPLSFSELATRLQVSRGSVSTNARLLRGLGIIEHVSRPGDRQDYYRLSDDPYGRLLDGYVRRMQERRSIIEEAAAGTADAPTRERLRALGDFYAAAIEASRALGRSMREDDEQ